MDPEIRKEIVQSTSTSNFDSDQISSLNLDYATSADLSGEDECYDAVILHCEKDCDKAEDIVKEINNIKLKNGNLAKAESYELAFIKHTEKFDRLHVILKRSSYVFILCTTAFIDDQEIKYMADECLMNSIMNKEKKQPWQVVPIIYAEEKRVTLPFGLNALQPIRWGHKYALKQISNYVENGLQRKLIRSQSVPATMMKSCNQNTPESDLSSVCSGYETEDEQGENENSFQEKKLSFNSEDDMATSSLKDTKHLPENQPKSRNSMDTVSLKFNNLSLQESQENMATSSLQSIKPPLQESQPIPESKDNMATSSLQSIKPPLQESQPIPESKDNMATSSLQSIKPPLQESQPIPESKDNMATSSLQSIKPLLQESQPIPESKDNMATSSLQSIKPLLQENQPIADSQESMASPSFQSTNSSLQGSGSQDNMVTSSLQFTNPCLHEGQLMVDSQDSTATPSLQENQPIADSQDSMASSGFQSTNSSLQENQSIADSQDSMVSPYIQSPNSSDMQKNDSCFKEDNKDKERKKCCIS